ncbi:MAG: type II secretion system protein [Opitutaceae bacterium]|jgi:prepilin-type N-terminal cleavage/methylation domain-containing protein
MKPLPDTNRATGGFTLVELLTVIAIIAVLGSLAIVGIQSAMKNARDSRCSGNLRALHIGMSLYSTDWKHWPTLNRETPSNPALYGTQPWYYSLLQGGYIITRKETIDGYLCLKADALICPSNDANPGSRYTWTSAPYPWIPNYAINSYWGTNNGKDPQSVNATNDWVRTLGGIVNPSAILLIDSSSSPSLYPSSNADWASSGCLIPRNLHGTGAHAVLANGAVITVSPASHPDIKDPKYWDPRYTAN